MKIGTLTFHRAQNYGGVLQCYALLKFLQNQGYDVEVVDYRCPKIERAYRIIDTYSFKSILASLLYLAKRIKAKKNFASFRKKYLKISDKKFKSPGDFSGQYDICIMGSDQVWTLRLVGGFNPIFYGDFSPSIRKIGYAVSIAEINHFSVEERNVMAKHIDNFTRFSTREDSFRDEMIRLSGKKVYSVLDPSLLLSMNEYDPILELPQEENYILYYQQEYHPLTKNLIVDIAHQVGAKMVVVVTGTKEHYDIPCHYYDTDSLSVPKFLGLFKKAKVVFTSSFHGTAYSIVFRKDFYFVANYAPDRARNLLVKCGAEDRLVYSTDKVAFSKVDYSKVEPCLENHRKESMQFLISAIENK
ncbi:polysaccharide pyruvyl transferase family protein [Prevotella sp. MA2016]|uniref:polysaccharide pyruvyl transferase family protein n=1 Tax=Prevotella sp. MA2016 TaxID=1408310 RepID=UPI00048D10B7|nr:polysaccharide pyruvyl transferase family protein [Prevotella sp. MA2016]